MIPQKLHFPYSTFIIIFLFTLFSCEEKNNTNIQKPNSSTTEIKKLISIADKYYDTNKIDSSFLYYNKVKSICNPRTDSENYVSTLNRMADIQQNKGDYTGSETIVTESIPYLKYIENPKHAWNSYVILGNNYLYTYDYKNALLYFNKALQLNTSEWRKSAAKNNIAVTLMEEQKYHEALKIFLPLITKKEVLDNAEDYSRVLDNIGFCYFKINDSKALLYLTKSLDIKHKIKHDLGLGTSYIHLAKYHQKNSPALAKKYMLLSYKKFSIVNRVDDRMNSLKLLIKNSSGNELKKYSLEYIKINDSITEVRQRSKNQFAKLKYDSKTEKEENTKLKIQTAKNELQLERQKNRNLVSYLIIAFTMVIVLLLYYYLTIKGRKDKNEATYNSETRIAKKLHDELANDVYHTMAFAEHKNLALTENKEQLLNNLDTIYNRTRNISKENSIIITDKNYILYLKEMISGFNTPKTTIILNGLNNIGWNALEKNKKIAIYRVLQELLVNMKKHSNATLVGINFKKTGNQLFVNYNDNGKGIDINQMSLKNGLYNVENRIQAINGTIDFDSTPNKGFKVFFKISI